MVETNQETEKLERCISLQAAWPLKGLCLKTALELHLSCSAFETLSD